MMPVTIMPGMTTLTVRFGSIGVTRHYQTGPSPFARLSLVNSEYSQLLKANTALQPLRASSDKTLGTLIGRLMGDYILKEGRELPDDTPGKDCDSIHFGFRMQINLPAERHEALKAELRELVTLRNSLVHHFIDLHDLWTLDGCLQAQDALNQSYAEIDRHFEQLVTFAGYMDDARKAAADLIQSPQFRDMIINGIGPDGEIHWPVAGIVGALREAFQQLSIDGWVNLDAAARWVSEHHPQQTPQKYGCSRWRHVIHESEQFELRRFTHNGQFGAWYRERPNATAC